MTSDSPVTLSQFNARISALLNSAPGISGVWVVAETSDVRRNAHCYLELVEKDPLTGEPLARLRANIWRNTLGFIDAKFSASTGRRLESGMKVMVKISASFHPAYGLSANITDIDPTYTAGALLRRRREIIGRLTAEGVIDLNRELTWPRTALRVAVISARGAAGYGDFIHQLYTNSSRLAFHTRLFPALMQGQDTPLTIIAALEEIASTEEMWDCVVIIRGGGSTSDLAAFESYDLAANIAQFPLPVIIGIGHERDITVLDYVANMRVKTPTAAAEWLIAHNERELELLRTLASDIFGIASSMIAGCREQLARIETALPHLPAAALRGCHTRLDRLSMTVSDAAMRKLQPEKSRLDLFAERLSTVPGRLLERSRLTLDRIDGMVKVLSPEATLARGYSITRVDGHVVTSPAAVTPGTEIHTTLADGSTLISVAKE